MNKFYLICFLLIGSFFYFYRLPKQKIIPNNFDIVYSPAYGEIMEIKNESEYIYLAIFLSPFDVHYQFAPISGQFTEIKYDSTGQFNLAYELNKSNDNEKIIYSLENKRGKFIIYLIAGYLVRRISNFTEINKTVYSGETIGLIHFGSRVDIKIPNKNFKLDPNIKVGYKLNGTHSVIGKYTDIINK